MSNRYTLVYTRSFLNDALKIVSCKIQQGHADASDFYQGILAKLENLRDFPETGGRPEHYPVFCARGYRFLSYGSYNIFYAVRGRMVLCMRLRHAGRQPI